MVSVILSVDYAKSKLLVDPVDFRVCVVRQRVMWYRYRELLRRARVFASRAWSGGVGEMGSSVARRHHHDRPFIRLDNLYKAKI